MKYRHYALLLCCAATAITLKIAAYKAVIVVPVADLIGSPIASHAACTSYQDIPLSPNLKRRHYAACPRIHQLLFNEVVEVLEENSNEIKVVALSAFYTPTVVSSPQCTYWTRKEYCKPLAELRKRSRHGINLIPAPFSFNHSAISQTSATATLLNPVYDPVTSFTFSAGTRFILAQENQERALVWRYVPATNTFSLMPLSSTDYYLHTGPKPKDECIELFIAILRSWAQPDQTGRSIPYVWGGVSLGDRYPDNDFTLKNSTVDPSLTYYEVPSLLQSPKMGLDCSGLVLRAAQLAGIPYFFKNTKTIGLHMQPLKRHEQVREGDLILVQGHVMIISNLSDNTIIEARAYDQGYGKVQELPVSNIFDKVPTLARLVELHHAQQPVDRMDINGVICDHFPSVTILRMASAWDWSQH